MNNLVEKYPNNLLFETKKAECLVNLGRYDTAKPIIEKLMKAQGKVYPLAGNLFQGVIEEKQFAGAIVDFWMRRYAVERNPRSDALLLERFGIEQIALAALVEGRNRLASMDDNVGAGTIFQPAMRAEARAQRSAGPVHQSAPE